MNRRAEESKEEGSKRKRMLSDKWVESVEGRKEGQGGRGDQRKISHTNTGSQYHLNIRGYDNFILFHTNNK